MALDADTLSSVIRQFKQNNRENGSPPGGNSSSITIPTDDGGVLVSVGDRNPFQPDDDDIVGTDHFDNLAEKLDSSTLALICEDLLQGIEDDDVSRGDWLRTRAQGIDLLGLKLKEPRSDPGMGGAPLEGMSTVQHPLLLEACLRYQATARGEILPASGPAKIVDYSAETAQTNVIAEALEKDFNYWLYSIASEYVPDTDKMLFNQGWGGLGIKKIYNCPLRRRPVSESIEAENFIVSNAATDLRNASRITHRIMMRPAVLRRMQLVGAYKDVKLTDPSPTKNAVDLKKEITSGINPSQQRPEDRDHEILECYCELNIPGFEHRKDGEETGLPLPYRVTIEKTSREILEIRRNWDEEDDECQAKRFFVLFPFAPTFGIYATGLLHILGNATRALTAAWREMLDAGMFASFPGFLYSRTVGRQMTNEFRIPPGGGLGIETGGQPLQQMVMPLPYKDVGSGLMNLIEAIEQAGQRIGGTAEMQVTEGKQEAPVGSTLALIEQATKVMDAVHKRTHAAQGEEFQLLIERFREDPEAFWRHNKVPATQWDKQRFMQAINTYGLVPASDPNMPSHMHRVMKAYGLVQLNQAFPGVMDQKSLVLRALQMLNVDDPQSLIAPPPPPGATDPMAAQAQQATQMAKMEQQTRMAELADRDKDRQTKMALAAQTSQDKAADRESKEHIELLKMAKEEEVHPGLETLSKVKDLATPPPQPQLPLSGGSSGPAKTPMPPKPQGPPQ